MVEYFKGAEGRTVYGVPIGVIINKAGHPRFPGDPANASTYPFPTVFGEVGPYTIQRVVSRDPLLLKEYVEVIHRFEDYGVRAITTLCGFNIVFQDEMAKASKVPVFASSLLQLPLVKRMLKLGKKIGIITANGKIFNEHKDELLSLAGLTLPAPVVIKGIEDEEGWSSRFEANQHARALFWDQAKVEAEVVNAAKTVVSQDSDVGAIVLECHDLPPYAKAVQDATGLPVFNILTLVDMVYSAVVSKRYTGIM